MRTFRGKKSSGSSRIHSATSQKSLRDNLLKKYPVRIDEWEEDVIVKVIRNKFNSKIGRGFGRLLKTKPNYTVKLDEYGSVVWKLCDGRTKVEEIGNVLVSKFGKDAEPIYGRLAVFFSIMEKHKMIILKNSPE